MLGRARWKLPKKKYENPFVVYYAPDMDNTPALKQDLASWYQSMIGMLSYMLELGRVDIITEVSMMASQITIPRDGHLELVLHVFVFLLQKYNSGITCDPTYPTINMSGFKKFKLKVLYGQLE